MRRTHLELCTDCGRHAHVTLADGCRGAEFGFQSHGLRLVQSGIDHNRFSAPEARDLVTSIKQSNLPQSWRDVELAYLWSMEQWNVMLMTKTLPSVTVHEFLEQPIDPVEVPGDWADVLERLFG